MLPLQRNAAEISRPNARTFAEMIGAAEKLISSLVEIAGAGSSNPASTRSDNKTAQMASRQPTVVICAHDEAAEMVNSGRAVLVRDYMMRLMEAVMGLIAERNRSLRIAPLEMGIPFGEIAQKPAAEVQDTFRKTGMYWIVKYNGKQTLISDAKGLQYIATLLRHPGEEIHALRLATCGMVDVSNDYSNKVYRTSFDEMKLASVSNADGFGDAGEHLDAQAKSAYRRRVYELREELEDAKQRGEEERAVKLEEELDALLGELRRATGLRGRRRKAASIAERARINVTRAIKAALNRIGMVHPELEDHLMTSIRTGTFCSYRPKPSEPINWQL